MKGSSPQRTGVPRNAISGTSSRAKVTPMKMTNPFRGSERCGQSVSNCVSGSVGVSVQRKGIGRRVR